MKKAPILKDEIDRLKSLLDYQILETPAEDDFDNIVKMASSICEAPIALISLIDGDRQWFKAKIGMDATEAGRENSFCGHAIASNDLMIINDATKDERFFDNPAVTGGPMVKFYAGAPLQSASGHNIGALCVAGPVARQFSHEQEEVLRLLSQQVMTLLEYRKKVLSLNETITKFHSVVKEFDLNQADFMNAEKIDIVGGLASGVAHQINNPLAIIMVTANILRKKLEKSDYESVSEGLQKIEKTVHRIAGVVSELRNISEMSPEKFKDKETFENTFYVGIIEPKKS